MTQPIDDDDFISSDDGDLADLFTDTDDVDLGDLIIVKRKKSSGLTCEKCGEFYPYAEEPNQADGSFRCWACRH